MNLIDKDELLKKYPDCRGLRKKPMGKLITQAEIAKDLGITPGVVSNALRGLRPVGRDGKRKLYEVGPAWAAVQKYFEGRIDDVRYRTNVMLEEYERCADIAAERKGMKGV